MQSNAARNYLVDENAGNGSVLFHIIPVKLYGPNGYEEIYDFIDDGASIYMVDNDVVTNLDINEKSDVLEL